MRKNSVERPVYYNVRRVNTHWVARMEEGSRRAMREEAVNRFRRRAMRATGTTSSMMALNRMRDLMEVGELQKAQETVR